MAWVQVQVHVQGECPRCGLMNNAMITEMVDDTAALAIASAVGKCGCCGTPVRLVGDATQRPSAARREFEYAGDGFEGGAAEPQHDSPGRPAGGSGQIRAAAEALAEAIRRHPLENARDMEVFLRGLGSAAALIAEAETAASARVHEEFPAAAQVREALELTARQKRTAARAAEDLHGLYRRQHSSDYERFESPRNREEKLDYRNNRDVI